MITGKNGEDSRRYHACWSGKVCHLAAHKELPLAFFGEHNGYQRYEALQIRDLAIGEVWVSPGFGRDHTVTRVF